MATDYLLSAEDDDILTTEGEVEILAYTLVEAQEYGLVVDWDGDGEYDDFQEADRMLRWSSERGREKIYRPSGNGFNPYEIGRLTVTLDNHDGRYDPWNTDSPLYGDIMPGRNVQFSVTAYDAVDGHENYILFTGTLVNLRVNGLKKTVDLIVEDGWRFLTDWAFYRFPFTTGIAEVPGEIDYVLIAGISFNATAIDYVFTYDGKYPWGIDYPLGSGYENVPRHWWWDGTAKGAIEMITFGSLGRAWIRSNGVFGFATLQDTTDSPVTTLDEDILLKDILLPVPWENTRSEVVLKGSDNIWYGADSHTIASLREPVLVEAGDTVEISLPYTYPDVSSVICTRVRLIDFAAYANANGTGTNLTEFIQREVDPGFTKITITVTNVGATDAYVTTFDVDGEPLELIDRQWRFESDSPYRQASFVLDNPWLSVTYIGNASGYLEKTATTVNDNDRIELIGQSLLEHLSTVKLYPVVQMRGRWHEQFELELEDKITLDAPTLGIFANFRMSKIQHRSMGTPQDVLTTLWLYPPIMPVGVTDDPAAAVAGLIGDAKNTTSYGDAPSGDNRCLIVGVITESGSANTHSNLTYGGQAGTKIDEQQVADGANNLTVSVWRVMESAIASQSGGTIAWSNSVTVTNSIVVSQMFENIDQTSPVSESAKDYALAGGSNPITTVDIDGAVNNAIISIGGHGLVSTSASWHANLSELTSGGDTSSSASIAGVIAASTKTYECECTWSATTTRWAQISVELTAG